MINSTGMSQAGSSQPVGLSQPGGGPITRLRASPPVAALMLITLMLLLLVLVMVSPEGRVLSPVGYRIPLPTGEGVPLSTQTAHVLALDLNRKIWLDGQAVPPPQLVSTLAGIAQQTPPSILRVQGNAHLPYAEVQALVSQALSAGIPQVVLELDSGATSGPSLPGIPPNPAGTDRGDASGGVSPSSPAGTAPSEAGAAPVAPAPP